MTDDQYARTEMREVNEATSAGAWDAVAARVVPTLNIPLATKVMEHIEAHPDEHMQGEWIVMGHDLQEAVVDQLISDFVVEHDRYPTQHEVVGIREFAATRAPECGTAACFAGHAVLISGLVPLRDAWEYVNTGTVEDPRWTPVGVAAGSLLGLDGAHASRLFRATNTVDDLWDILGEYSGGQIRRPVSS